MLYNVKLDAEELFMVEFRFAQLKIKMKGKSIYSGSGGNFSRHSSVKKCQSHLLMVP